MTVPKGTADVLLRLEWAAAAAALAVAYHLFDGSWLVFALLVLLPDLSMLGYLAGPRIGAMSYNAAHTLLAPFALAACELSGGPPVLLQVALIWGFHIAFDRMLGYGLKLPTGFRDTTMGRIGRGRAG